MKDTVQYQIFLSTKEVSKSQAVTTDRRWMGIPAISKRPLVLKEDQ